MRGDKMVIRKYQPCDCKELTELFYHTVHTVNARDYTKEQLNVWATGKIDLEKWSVATAICNKLDCNITFLLPPLNSCQKEAVPAVSCTPC